MKVFLLDPAAADGALVGSGVLHDFTGHFPQLNPNMGRSIRRTARRRQAEGYITHMVGAEIQTHGTAL